MAVIKHISVKGSNGGDALNYVLYKHNEATGELIVDSRGNPVMRDEYYLDGINCEPYSFAAECKEVNDFYGKNQLPGDIKAHHFIISYDPKDGVEHGLTGSKAQQLSMEWAQRCLPGFQILVCTHMDGSNESGNIHTHIMMNSVRKHDTQVDDFGERIIDHLAGYKLNLTKKHLQFMKQELMDLCGREGLYQVDLLSPAGNRITDKEYRIQQHGQDNLDILKKRLEQDGKELTQTRFQTHKQYLRDAIKDVAYRATSFDDFCYIMQGEYNVTVKESRGRISYLHPKREKHITGRALGKDYETDAVLNMIAGEKTIITYKGENASKTPSDIPIRIETLEDCNKVFTMRTELKLVVRLQDCAKAQKSAAYANKLMVSNVKAMAETILFVQQNGFGSVKAIENDLSKLDGMIDTMKRNRSDILDQLKDVNEQIHYLGQYLITKRVYGDYLKTNNKTDYVKTHAKEIKTYNGAKKVLREKNQSGTFPTINELRERKNTILEKNQQLQSKLDAAVNQRKTLSAAYINTKKMIDYTHGDRNGRQER